MRKKYSDPTEKNACTICGALKHTATGAFTGKTRTNGLNQCARNINPSDYFRSSPRLFRVGSSLIACLAAALAMLRFTFIYFFVLERAVLGTVIYFCHPV